MFSFLRIFTTQFRVTITGGHLTTRPIRAKHLRTAPPRGVVKLFRVWWFGFGERWEEEVISRGVWSSVSSFVCHFHLDRIAPYGQTPKSHKTKTNAPHRARGTRHEESVIGNKNLTTQSTNAFSPFRLVSNRACLLWMVGKKKQSKNL